MLHRRPTFDTQTPSKCSWSEMARGAGAARFPRPWNGMPRVMLALMLNCARPTSRAMASQASSDSTSSGRPSQSGDDRET